MENRKLLNLNKITGLTKLLETIKQLTVPKIVYEVAYVLLYHNQLLPTKTKTQLESLIDYTRQTIGLNNETNTYTEQEIQSYVRLLDELEKLIRIRYSQVIQVKSDEEVYLHDIRHYKELMPYTNLYELYLAYIGSANTTDTDNKIQLTESEILTKLEQKLVKQVDELYALLRLIAIELDIVNRSIDILSKTRIKSITEVISQLSNVLYEEYEQSTELRHSELEQELLTDINVIAKYVSEDIQNVYSLPTFVYEIDSVTKGLVPGTVIAFAGTLGTGKSGTLLNIALGLTLSCAIFSDYIRLFWPDKYQKHKPIVVYITLENSRQLTNMRILQILTDSDYDRIRNTIDLESYVKHSLQEKQIPFAKYFSVLANKSGLLIVEAVSIQFGIAELEAKIKELLHAGYYPVAIVLDYMDEMYVPHSHYSEYRFKFGLIAQGLKTIASKYNTIIVTATQLNRKAIESGEISVAVLSESIEHAKRLDYMVGIRSESIPLVALDDPIEYIKQQDKHKNKKSNQSDSQTNEIDIEQQTVGIGNTEYTRIMLYATIKDRTTGSADNRIRYILSSPISRFGFMSQLYGSYLYILSLYDSAILKSIIRQYQFKNTEPDKQLVELAEQIEQTSIKIKQIYGLDINNTQNALMTLILKTLMAKEGVVSLADLSIQKLYKLVKTDLSTYLTDLQTASQLFDNLVSYINTNTGTITNTNLDIQTGQTNNTETETNKQLQSTDTNLTISDVDDLVL